MFDNQQSFTRGLSIMENSMDKMWDMWLVSLGSLTWTQDQIEVMTRKQMEQNKTARNEVIKLAEDMSEQVRRNQEQFQKMAKETIINTCEQITSANQNWATDFSDQMDVCSERAEEKKASIPKISASSREKKTSLNQAQA